MDIVNFLLFIIGALILLLIVGTVLRKKETSDAWKKIKEKSSQIGAIDAIIVEHVEGLGLGEGVICNIFSFTDKILIESNTHKFEIKVSKLRAVVVKTEKELIEKNKSVVGRALIGSLLVPGLGTIVGGMSGIGTTQEIKAIHYYLIINFINAEGELSGITFKTKKFSRALRFCKEIEKNIIESSNDEVIEL